MVIHFVSRQTYRTRQTSAARDIDHLVEETRKHVFPLQSEEAAARTHSIDEYARILAQHHSVVHMKEKLLPAKDPVNLGRSTKIALRTASPSLGILATVASPTMRLRTR